MSSERAVERYLDPGPSVRVRGASEGTPVTETGWHALLVRRLIVQLLTTTEDLAYVVLALLLGLVTALVLGHLFAQILRLPAESVIVLALDRILIVLMLMEILHTILIFLRTHRIQHEPFLVIGIVAAIRRVLILTAQESATAGQPIGRYLAELAATTLVILVLAWALRLSRNQ